MRKPRAARDRESPRTIFFITISFLEARILRRAGAEVAVTVAGAGRLVTREGIGAGIAPARTVGLLVAAEIQRAADQDTGGARGGDAVAGDVPGLIDAAVAVH